MIAANKIWLFQTGILDPFIFETTDGIAIRMESERVIELLTIATAVFYFDNTANGVLNWSTMYGGEDTGATVVTGKSEVSYELMFDFPNYSPEMIERLIGNEWAVLIETAGRDRLIIFARFEADGYDFENDQKGQVVLKSGRTSSKPYRVLSATVTQVTYTIDREYICNLVNVQNFIPID
jgi:hypothetical protein